VILIERRTCELVTCPTILAGPEDPDLCQDCVAAFERQGIATSVVAVVADLDHVDEQLTLDLEETAA
jgi:hypothetical protein